MIIEEMTDVEDDEEKGLEFQRGYKKPTVKLSGEDGNALFIIGKTIKALRKAGATKEQIDKYKKEATSGDYDNVIGTTMDWVDVI